MALLLGAAVAVGGCEAKDRQRARRMRMPTAQASAEGKAEEGQIALSTPGFDVKLNVPLDRAETDGQASSSIPDRT